MNLANKPIYTISRITILIVLCSGFCTALSARDDLKGAIGARTKIGWDASFYGGAEISLRTNFKGIRCAEYDFGWAGSTNWNGYQFTFLYQWKLIRNGGFNFYIGTGPSFAYINHYREDNMYVFALMGDVGVSYTFGFPIQLALDWRPGIDLYSDLGERVAYDFGLAIRLGF